MAAPDGRGRLIFIDCSYWDGVKVDRPGRCLIISGRPKIGPVKVRLAEIGTTQVCVAQVCSAQIRPTQVCLAEVYAFKVGPTRENPRR